MYICDLTQMLKVFRTQKSMRSRHVYPKLCMYDKRFHNKKHNVKASIAVGLPGLFSPSEWNNVEASTRIDVATESITEVENTMAVMIPWVITQVIATNTGILVIWSPSAIVFTSSSYRICKRIAKTKHPVTSASHMRLIFGQVAHDLLKEFW